MKSKFSPSELDSLSFLDYRQRFYKELARMKSDNPDASTPTSFLLLSEFEFADQKGKAIPMLIVGEFTPEWKKFIKTEMKKRKQRDWAVGKCSFGDKDSDGQNFNLILIKGKVTNTWSRLLDKVLFNKANLKTNLTEGKADPNDPEFADAGDDEGGSETVKNAATTATVATDTVSEKPEKKKPKTKEEAIAQVKEKTREEATDLSNVIKDFKLRFAPVKEQVLPKLKSGEPMNRNDWALVKLLNASCTAFLSAYNESNKLTQKTFDKARQEVEAADKETKKLATIVKEKKQSLAEILSNKFFEKNAKRPANPKEIEQMQAALKNAFSYRKIESLKSPERENSLKAIYLTATLRGPKFTPENTDVVFAKLSA